MLTYLIKNNLIPLISIGLYIEWIWVLDAFKSPIQIVFHTLKSLYHSNPKSYLAERYGNWAVVTGCTDGIGRRYAFELASRGINIVLIARNVSKLIQVSDELEIICNVQTKWIKADLSLGKEVLPHLKKELEGIPVGILVNNAGRMYDYPESFYKVDEQLLWDIMTLNMLSLTMLTHFLIPDMKKRGKGMIVNVSSGSQENPMPYTAIYGASKAYVKNLTLALQYELMNSNIDVQLLSPMYVRTKMNEYSTSVMNGNIFCPDVVSFTKSAVFLLGKTDRTTGYWLHGIQFTFNKLAPEWVRTYFVAILNENYLKKNCALKIMLPYILFNTFLGMIAAGLYIEFIWCYEVLRSPIQIILSLLKQLFQGKSYKRLADRYGEWAVVTGSTDGIGREYAFELAHQGINIVLISRTESKLVQVANEILNQYKVQVKWIKADLSLGKEVFPYLKEQLKDIPVGILVNNAGRMSDFPQEFEKIDEETMFDIMTVNMISLTMLTHFLLNEMKKRDKGIIVNVSSGTARQAMPYEAVYAASKAFVTSFTLALQWEIGNSNIEVQLLSPNYVRTKMVAYSSSLSKGNIFCPDVSKYTKSAVFTLGKSKRTSGYWSHYIENAFLAMAPEFLRIWVVTLINKRHIKQYNEQQKKSAILPSVDTV
uniref:CSON008628 protein n=1 Tax=Culicoides sonorensis TaxID=179676 RepID=A0A336LCA5_CULSO